MIYLIYSFRKVCSWRSRWDWCVFWKERPETLEHPNTDEIMEMHVLRFRADQWRFSAF